MCWHTEDALPLGMAAPNGWHQGRKEGNLLILGSQQSWMDGIASVYQWHETISRHAMMYLVTSDCSLNHTSLAMTPEDCAVSLETWVLTSARAGHSKNHAIESRPAPEK